MARCPRCGYEWATRSKRRYVTCPSCRYNFRNPAYSSHKTTSGVIKPVQESWDSSSSHKTGKRVIKLQGCGDEKGACGVYEFDEEVWQKLRRRALERDAGPGIEVLVVDDRVWDEVVGT